MEGPFLCRVPGSCFSLVADLASLVWQVLFLCHIPGLQVLFLRSRRGSPALHRAPLNELRPVHHEAVFGAPGLSRTREGGFRYRISPPYQESLFFTPNASENASRTPGACFLHGAHIPYRRRPFLVQHPHPTPSIHHHPAYKKKSRLNVTSIGTSEKRQLPTLPPGGAVPSALVSLTSLFGMGRGGSSPL